MESERFYRAVFVITLALTSLALVAGISHALLMSGRLPPLRRDYLAYVVQMLEAEEYSSAIDQLRLATEMEPAAVQAARLLAEVARRSGDLETEIYALRLVRRRNPQDVDVRNAVSRALLERGGDAKMVIRNSLRALETEPNSAAAHGYLAEAYWVQGDKEQAAEHLREALRLDPTLDADKMRLTRELQGY